MLTTVPGCQLHDAGSDQCAIVSFTVDGLKPAETIGALREKGIVIGTSKPSSTPLDAETRKLPILMRAAPHYYNTEDELMQLVNGLKNLSQ